MSETGSKLRMGLLAASVVLYVPAFAATAFAHDPYPSDETVPNSYYPYPNAYQEHRGAHIKAEQDHMARERHHLRQDERARDEALRHGDLGGAWAEQQHIHQQRHHLWHEQEHVDHE